jgi:EpsD family peptidyl-prolyl cis-trans isomerase
MFVRRSPFGSRGQRFLIVAAAALACLGLAGCGEKKDEKKATQTAAKVNKDEITVHQINFVLQQQRGIRPEQAEVAGKQVLERLIDQQLAVQKGEDLKIDRDPRVVQQLDAARREIVARAYFDRIAEAAVRPTAEEIKAYYDSKPALFSERRIYSLQELVVDAKPEQVAGLRERLQAAKNVAEFVDFLKANEFKFTGNQAVRAAEQLPLANLDAFAKLKDGQAIFNEAPNGAQIVVLAGSRSQPVSLDQARPAIEAFILNERKRELITKDTKSLRDSAKISYEGKFAPSAPAASAAVATQAPAVAPPVSAASGPLDASAVTKGMGLK